MSDYAFTPGMDVYVPGAYGREGRIVRVEKLSRGFAVVDGENYRMSGWPVHPPRFSRGASIRPATPEDIDRVRRDDLAHRLSSAKPEAWTRLPADRLASILADLVAANPARTP